MKIFHNINETEYDDEGYPELVSHKGILYGMEDAKGYFGILCHYEPQCHDIILGFYLLGKGFYIGWRWKNIE